MHCFRKEEWQKPFLFIIQRNGRRRGNLLPLATKCRAAVARLRFYQKDKYSVARTNLREYKATLNQRIRAFSNKVSRRCGDGCGIKWDKLYNQGRALYVIRSSGMESICQNCMESSQKMTYAYRQFHTRQAVMPYQAFWLE